MDAVLIPTVLAVLFFVLLVVVKASLAVRRLKTFPEREGDLRQLNSSAPRALTGGKLFETQERQLAAKFEAEEARAFEAARREEILSSARGGDKDALRVAASLKDEQFYARAFDEFASRGESLSQASDEWLREVAECVTSSEDLRASANFANEFAARWSIAPDEKTLPTLLQIAARTNDAETFRRTIEKAFAAWRARLLPRLNAKDLDALFESHYWLLSSSARSSSAGFALKERISDLRRELSAEGS